MVDNVVRFEVNMEEIEKINPLFSKAKVKVLYTGINRNQTHFSKSAVEAALPSIYNIPIVGEYLEAKENFGGHGGKIEITGQGIEWIQTTKPYGVVSESANIYWEDVTESNGTINEYLVIDGVYLWTGRYDELENVLEQSYGQSMEIEVVNGDFTVVDGIQTYDIKEFVFSALCILGVDKDGEGHVEPCFESASISAYSLDKEDFKKQFNKMIAELKFSLTDKGGIAQVNEKLELLKKYSLTEEELKEKSINLEDFSVEELEEKLKEISNPPADFALVASQLREEIRAELYKDYTEDEWGYKSRSYWYVDHTEDMVIAEDTKDNYRLIGMSYSVNGDAVVIDFETKKRMKIAYEPFEGESEIVFNLTSKDKVEYDLNVKEKQLEQSFSAEKENAVFDVNKELTTLSENFTKLEEEVKGLRDFKELKVTQERVEKETELFDSFSAELTEDEMKPVKETSSEFTLAQLEEKLFTLVGKKKATFAKQTKKEKQTVKIEVEHNEEKPKAYGGLFEKYSK